MKLVIDIEESIYKECIPYKDTPIISNIANYNSEIIHAIANGTPLPETNAGDLISRQAVRIALLDKGQHSKRYKLGETWELNLMEIEEALEELPSVEPERKSGKWIRGEAYPHRIYCSECYKTFIPNDEMRAWVDGDLPRKYCPECGARMEVDNGTC